MLQEDAARLVIETITQMATGNEFIHAAARVAAHLDRYDVENAGENFWSISF